jgi:predicted nucleic-acid-binding protein
MIGVDTSVVVRYLVGTPEEQAVRAAAVIDGEGDMGLSIVAPLETAHVLRTQYGVSRSDVVGTLIDLVTRANVVILELPKADVIESLVRARSLPSAPIPDAFIATAARSFGAVPVFTFDHDFGRLGAPVAAP